MKKRPNILFMLSDDHAVRAISALGSVVNQTPNLDRIAREGGVFEESFCCNSICTPSRAAILTGKHSFQNGVLTLDESLNPDQTTFAGLLRESGYQTALAGKWHLHCKPKDFDFWKILPGQGNYQNPDYITPEGVVREAGFCDDLTTDSILDWMENTRDKEKPFLACCQFKAPHRAWFPPLRHLELFKDTIFPQPPNLGDDYSGRCGLLKENKMEIARHMNWNTDLKVHDGGPNSHRLNYTRDRQKGGESEYDRMSPEQLAAYDKAYAGRRAKVLEKEMDNDEFRSWAYQAYMNDYLGCVQGIDDNVGRLLDYLDEAGLSEDTIVVYCSDQGFYLGEHGWFDKRWIFEESMRMPLLIRWPGAIPEGSRYSQLVQNIDYAPTFLEACGIHPPEDMHGTSLLRVVEGREIHENLYYHYYMDGGHGVPAHDGVRTKRYKLVNFYTANEFNLFDLEQDPKEMGSLHDNPTYRGILEEMKKRYFEARKKYEVPDEFPPALPDWSCPRQEEFSSVDAALKTWS